MPKINTNGLDHSYQQMGEGRASRLVHGALADVRMRDYQLRHFASNYRQLRYGLRGHGQRGASRLDNYIMDPPQAVNATLGDFLCGPG